MTPLPIDRFVPEILEQARAHRALVLVAEPGAGKTTRVPPTIVRSGMLGAKYANLVMLQPRRVAARAAAERIADENGWSVGNEVGYHVRFDRRIGPNTRLRVVTEGILTRQLLDDPFLDGVGAVLLDEFHERSIYSDVAIALLREVWLEARADLILIVMSATLDAEPVSKFLNNCPVLRVPGRTFPVEIEHRAKAAGSSRTSVVDRMADAISAHIDTNPDGGDLLAFLPGAQEINRTAAAIASLADRHDLLVLPLHGSLPSNEQSRALQPSNRRKIVLATNIAETSLTIDGVDAVIDSGLARVVSFDPGRGLDSLNLQQVSKASATQRAGRAGRTRPGRCVRLWSRSEEQAMDDFTPPEIRRVDLSGVVLSLHAWGRPDVRQFGWYEAPEAASIDAAEMLLERLGAIKEAQITSLGQNLVGIPAHPRIARLLVAAADIGALDAGCAMAAILSEKDFVTIDYATHPRNRGPSVQGASDLLLRLEQLQHAEKSNFAAYLRDDGIDPAAARQTARLRDELVRQTNRMQRHRREASDDDLLRIILVAYPDRVVRRREGDSTAGIMVGGTGVRQAPESCVLQSPFYVAIDARDDSRGLAREAVVRIASAIDPRWLSELFPDAVKQIRAVEYDAPRDRVVARGTTFYHDLPIREDSDGAIDPQLAAEALAKAATPRALEIFEADDRAREWLARLALVRKFAPEHAWPKIEADSLVEVLVNAAHGKRSLEDLKRSNLADALQAQLAYPLDRLLDQFAPTTLTAPSGSQIKLAYSRGDKPIFEARLQEVFGWTTTPRVVAGRVPIVLHLLAPNFRPVQVTEDLASFWSTTYFQVRKDLKIRYPRHAWPDDPLTAKAEAKGSRRRG